MYVLDVDEVKMILSSQVSVVARQRRDPMFPASYASHWQIDEVENSVVYFFSYLH